MKFSATLFAAVCVLAAPVLASSNVLPLGMDPVAQEVVSDPKSDAMPEPVTPIQPPRLPRGVRILQYGIAGPEVGQALTLDYVANPGMPTGFLRVTGGQPGSMVSLLVGRKPAYLPFPWGDAFRVQPEMTVGMGRFSPQGVVMYPFDLRHPFLIGSDLYLQAVEMLAIDPYPWSLHTSWGLWLTVHDWRNPPLTGTTEFSWGQLRLDADLEILESHPPQYAVTLDANVPTTGYALRHNKTLWSKTGTVDVYFTLTEPARGPDAPPQIEPEKHGVRVELGEGLECWTVRVHVNYQVAGQHYFVEPPYTMIERWVIDCEMPGSR